VAGDGRPDARRGVYALGAVGYFLLAGRPPFEGERPIKVMIAHAHQDVVPPSEHVGTIPGDLEQVVLRCLEKDPAPLPDRRRVGRSAPPLRGGRGLDHRRCRPVVEGVRRPATPRSGRGRALTACKEDELATP